MIRILLDENLSPAVGRALRDNGHDVVHVRDRGLLGASDPEVLDHAFAEDRVLVTANVADFRRLTERRDLHAGVGFILDGGLVRDEQLEVLRRVIDALGHEGDLINRAHRPDRRGFVIEELPRGA